MRLRGGERVGEPRGTRVSCRGHIPRMPAGRPIKRMQIKTFYLNDNITLVDASALA